jgi:DNA-binding transcriptional ArsR family regulator
MTSARGDKGEPYQQILSRLSQIQHKVDSIDETNAFTLRADPRHHETVKKIFKRGKRRAQIYLAADGSRSVQEIGHHLDMKMPNVSRELGILKKEGMIALTEAAGRQDFYTKKNIDSTLRITNYLCGEYDLREDGRPNASARKRKANRKK